jgi:hypothetical protein
MKVKYKEEGLERFIFTMDALWASDIIVKRKLKSCPLTGRFNLFIVQLDEVENN